MKALFSRPKNYFVLAIAIIFIFAQGCSKSGSTSTPTPTPAPPITPPIVHATAPPTTANFDKLTVWNANKTGPPSTYDLLLIGDSYTQGNYYTWRLRNLLLGQGYGAGGSGYCSFGRAFPTVLASIDGSIEPTELTFTYDTNVWTAAPSNAYGPCGNVQNTTANSIISVTSTVALSTMAIIYERHSGEGDFMYRINGGSWTTVSPANSTQAIGNTVVDVSGAGSNIQMDIEPLSANEIFCGVLGRRTGNVLTIHKVGSWGQQANFFAQNALWTQSTQLLTPKGVVIMLGTNEMIANVTPDQMKINVQNIIDKVRSVQPAVDIMLMCPPETEYENEIPRTYKIVDYGAMLYQLALTNNAAFIYFPTIFGPFSQASVDNGLMDADRVDPGTAGSQLIANTIFSALTK